MRFYNCIFLATLAYMRSEDIKFYILEIMRGLEVYSETKSFRSTVALLNQFNSPKNSTTSFGSLPSVIFE